MPSFNDVSHFDRSSFDLNITNLPRSKSSWASALRFLPISSNLFAKSQTISLQFSSVTSSAWDLRSWMVQEYHSGKYLLGRSSTQYTIVPVWTAGVSKKCWCSAKFFRIRKTEKLGPSNKWSILLPYKNKWEQFVNKVKRSKKYLTNENSGHIHLFIIDFIFHYSAMYLHNLGKFISSSYFPAKNNCWHPSFWYCIWSDLIQVTKQRRFKWIHCWKQNNVRMFVVVYYIWFELSKRRNCCNEKSGNVPSVTAEK